MKQILIFLMMSNSFGANLSLNFLAKTNVPGVSVEGKLKNPITFLLNNPLEISIPVEKLTTGMDMRDQHMRSEVFSGKPIKIVTNKSETEKCLNGNEKIKLTLNLGNVEKEQTLNCKKESNKIFVSTRVFLSDFQIDRPNKFGVKVKDEVEVDIVIQL